MYPSDQFLSFITLEKSLFFSISRDEKALFPVVPLLFIHPGADALIHPVTGITAPDCAAENAVPGGLKASSEFTLLPRTARQLSDNDRLLLLLISVFKIYSIIIGRRLKISQGFFRQICLCRTDRSKNIDRHTPAQPYPSRMHFRSGRSAAVHRIAKTRSKCRRCFTVSQRYGCVGNIQIIYDISPQYNKDRFPIARRPDWNVFCGMRICLSRLDVISFRYSVIKAKHVSQERSENRWFCLLVRAYRSASVRVYALTNRHSNSRGRAERFLRYDKYRERMIIYTEKTDFIPRFTFSSHGTTSPASRLFFTSITRWLDDPGIPAGCPFSLLRTARPRAHRSWTAFRL